MWSDARTEAEIKQNMFTTLDGTEANLEGYWKFNADGTDTTSNGNDLTNNNSATFTNAASPYSETITYDAESNYNGGTGTSHTWTHTTGTDDNRILWVHVMNASTVAISGVTYNSVSMTQAVANGASQRSSLYYLIAPDTGSNTVEVTLASSSYCYTNALSFSGVAQEDFLGGTQGNDDTNVGTLSTSVTTGAFRS